MPTFNIGYNLYQKSGTSIINYITSELDRFLNYQQYSIEKCKETPERREKILEKQNARNTLKLLEKSKIKEIPEIIFHLIKDFMFSHHSNSVFPTHKRFNEIGFHLCYECREIVGLDAGRQYKRHIGVINTNVYERKHLAPHVIVLCDECCSWHLRNSHKDLR